MNKILLDALITIGGGITEGFGHFMAEAAAVCFDSQGHKSGVEMKVITASQAETFIVEWSIPIDDTMLRTHRDENRATDFGAMALAVLLAIRLTDYSEFTVSKKGEGMDFWLANDENMFAARLEISGIRKESISNTIANRLSIKKHQTQQSDSTGTPAYIAISEFYSPKGNFVKK